jgi:hypothetical protein
MCFNKVIRCFLNEGHMLHPIVQDSLSGDPMYGQYIDYYSRCPDQARLLKKILDTFSATISLAINYTKSTFVPLNMDFEEQTLISSILGCPIATFPQTYLGLPLSDSKLSRWALFPLLDSLYSRVDTLSIKGASSGGRLTLMKLVLSALLAHLLACIKAPKWFYKEIDSKRRGYFWTRQTSASGGQCKIA